MIDKTDEIEASAGREAYESSDLLYAGTCSTANDEQMTMDKLNEAMELIKALAPKEAPADANIINGLKGLRIIRNDILPEGTIIVSKRLFDLIYESSST